MNGEANVDSLLKSIMIPHPTNYPQGKGKNNKPSMLNQRTP